MKFQKSVSYIGLDLCHLLNININSFDNLKLFETYLKYIDLSKIIEL